MGHLIFSQNQAETAVKKWGKLQAEIKQVLLERGKGKHPKLVGNQLPEIHAERLVQSGEYYRWDNAPTKDYWRQHLVWLDEALKIIRHAQPEIFYGNMIGYRRREIERWNVRFGRDNQLIEEIGIAAHNSLYSILTNPYAKGITMTLAAMERRFAAKSQTYEVICDDYDHCKGITTLSIFDEMHKKGITSSGVVPRFLSSADESLIQMADVVSYAGGQVIWVNLQRELQPDFMPNQKIAQVIKSHQKYIRALDRENTEAQAPRGEHIDALSLPIYMDLVLDYVGGPPSLRQVLAEGRDFSLELLLNVPPK